MTLMRKYKTYLGWISNPVPSDGDEGMNLVAHATRLKHLKRRRSRWLSTYRAPLATQKAWELGEPVGYQKYWRMRMRSVTVI